MRIYADCVQETTASTGADPFTLAGAVAGSRAFGSVMKAGDTCGYSCKAVDANGAPSGQWETGVATMLADGTLQRAPQAGSQALPVPFAAGTKLVFLSENAADIIALAAGSGGGGIATCNLHLSGTFVPPNNGWQPIPFNSARHDPLGAFNVANAGRITVPGGVTRCRLTAYASYQNAGTDARYLEITKNGLDVGANGIQAGINNRSNEGDYSTVTEWLDVVPGDYFYCQITNANGVAIYGDDHGTGFGGVSYFQAEFAASLDRLDAANGGPLVSAYWAGAFHHTSDGGTLVPDTVAVNVGNAWDQPGGVFTAPYSGWFRFEAYMYGQSPGAYMLHITLGSGDDYTNTGTWDDNLHVSQGINRVVYMDAGSTARVNFQRGNNPQYNGGKGGSYIMVSAA